MDFHSLEHISTKFVPSVGLGENTLAQSTRPKAAFFSVFDLKNEFHSSILADSLELMELRHLQPLPLNVLACSSAFSRVGTFMAVRSASVVRGSTMYSA